MSKNPERVHGDYNMTQQACVERANHSKAHEELSDCIEVIKKTLDVNLTSMTRLKNAIIGLAERIEALEGELDVRSSSTNSNRGDLDT